MKSFDVQLAAVARQCHEFIGIADLEGRAQFINAYGRRLVGMTSDETLAGRSILDFVHPRDHARLNVEIMPALTASGRWSGELSFRRLSDGAPIPMLHEGLRIDDAGGRPLCIATAGRDLSELKTAHGELRDLERAYLEETDRQQQRLGREVHDGLGQELTGLSLLVGALAREALRGRPIAAGEYARVEEIARNAIRTASDIARGLSPLAECEGDLIKSIRQLVDRLRATQTADMELRVHEGAPLALNYEARNNIFRIVQEALTNALRHAHASRIEVQVDVECGQIRFAIADDGIGLGRVPDGSGIGLRTMRYRALSMRGMLSVREQSTGGCVVECVVPQPIAHAGHSSGNYDVAPSSNRSSKD